MATSRTGSTETEKPGREAAAGGCCGGPAPKPASACCAKDHEIKAGGGVGCGCQTAPKAKQCC